MLHPRSIHALPAHNPRTGHRTVSPYGLVGAATHDSVIIIVIASTIAIIVVVDDNARHRGSA
jgi:hypothetical protein